jgi:16S rRNA (cytosine1402-N4)-methyltransferase
MGEHTSVLLEESIALLDIRDGLTYVDLTLGRGGHSSEILRRIPHGHLYAFDIDEEAIEESEPRLKAVGSNFTIIRENFAYAAGALGARGVGRVDGIIMDLGVSSPQFDEGARGFSYREDGPLDMRMDQRNPLTAEKIVNTYDYGELKRIFKEYGEDPDAGKVAKAICQARERKPITSTLELADIIKGAKPRRELLKKGHPAKQIFQALRIEVNDEMGNLRKALSELPTILGEGGSMAVISFQSLEDRMVKRRFAELTERVGTRHGPESMEMGREPDFLSLTKKPITPSEAEIEANHRAKSAKLRAIKRKGGYSQ